jgi:hypothetical protein
MKSMIVECLNFAPNELAERRRRSGNGCATILFILTIL